jgi:hypothetical protein
VLPVCFSNNRRVLQVCLQLCQRCLSLLQHESPYDLFWRAPREVQRELGQRLVLFAAVAPRVCCDRTSWRSRALPLSIPQYLSRRHHEHGGHARGRGNKQKRQRNNDNEVKAYCKSFDNPQALPSVCFSGQKQATFCFQLLVLSMERMFVESAQKS